LVRKARILGAGDNLCDQRVDLSGAKRCILS
jgi:hypothetical protein